MATQPGKLMIIQRPDPANAGQWLNLCGFDNTTLTFTNEVNQEQKVNCTNRALAVETVRSYGAQSMTFSGSGLFDDDASGTWAHERAFAQDVVELRVFVPGYGYFECATWYIGDGSFSGGPTGNLQQNMTFEASGGITFTAV